MNYDALNDRLGNRPSRKVGNNTYLNRRGLLGFTSDPPRIAVTLHWTDVVTYYADGRITLDSGGYRTVTTKGRMNDWTPEGIGIHQVKGEWFVTVRAFFPRDDAAYAAWLAGDTAEYPPPPRSVDFTTPYYDGIDLSELPTHSDLLLAAVA